MLRSLLILFSLLLASTSTYGQRTVSADSQTLEALLEEVRQLRQDLRSTSVTSLRAQILLHRVQLQEAAVVRLSQKVESAQVRLAESQSAQQRVTDQIHALENRKQATSDSREEQELEHGLENLKRNLQQFDREVQQRQAKASEAEEQMRGEQDKLSELEDQLERLDKELERVVRRPSTSGNQ
jgi:DNA repair exonuclease SbcCD ATPase subunit